MTLGIAMVTPWGKGREIAAALSGQGAFARGVAVVVDSRFSADGKPQSDAGAKLWILSSGVAAVLAGRVTNAEKALDRAKKRFRGATPSSVSQAANVLQEALMEAVPVSGRRGPREECFLLVGVSSLDGDAAIVRFESARDFSPEISYDDQFIGQTQMKHDIYSRLRHKAHLAFDGDPWSESSVIVTEPGALTTSLAASLDDLVTAQINTTVGGRPQMAYVLHGKSQTMSAYFLNELTGDFEKRTAGYDEVQTATRQLARRRLAGFKRN